MRLKSFLCLLCLVVISACSSTIEFEPETIQNLTVEVSPVTAEIKLYKEPELTEPVRPLLSRQTDDAVKARYAAAAGDYRLVLMAPGHDTLEQSITIEFAGELQEVVETLQPTPEPDPNAPSPENPNEPGPDNPDPDNPNPNEPDEPDADPDNPVDPAEPTPEEPTPEDPAPEEPAPEEPAPDEPTPEDPAPDEPTPEDPMPDEPVPEDPTEPEPNNPDTPDEPQPEPEPTPEPEPEPEPEPAPPPPPPPPVKNAYYVSKSGNDNNDGLSPATAWRSLARASKGDLKAGYPLLLERGSVFRETLYIRQGGSANQRFTVSNYGEGKLPIISGADLVGNWTSQGGGVYSAAFAYWPQHVWHSNEMLNYNQSTGLAEGQFSYKNGQLYVRLEGGANPNDNYIEASVRDAAVRDETGHRYVTLDGLVGEKTNGTSVNDAVFTPHRLSEYWIVKNSVARYGAANGFFGEQNWTQGIGNYFLLQNSESHHNRRRGAVAAGYNRTGQVIDGLYSHHNRADGVLINSSNGVLKNSQLEFNGTGGGEPKHGFYVYPYQADSAKNWQISGNTLRGNRDSGGRVTGQDHEIYGNTFLDSPYGLFIVDTDGPTANHLVEDNLFQNTNPNSFSIELQGVESVRIRANRFFNSSGVGLIKGSQRNNSGVNVLDNVFAGNPENAYIELGDAQDTNFSQSENCFDQNIKLSVAPEITTQNAGRDRIYLPNCGQ